MPKIQRTETDPTRAVGYIRVSTERQHNGRGAERDALRFEREIGIQIEEAAGGGIEDF